MAHLLCGGMGVCRILKHQFLRLCIGKHCVMEWPSQITDVSQTLVYKGLQEMTHFEFMETLSLNKHSTVNNIQFHKSSTKKQAMCVLIL